MQYSAILFGLFAAATLATQAQAQNCPLDYSGWDGEEAAERICSAIRSFNQNGVPGVLADDCEGDDCCDDSDPTWLPAPPYSAIISISESSVHISRLDERYASEIKEILEYSDILDDHYGGYGERRRIPSLESGYSYGVPNRMRDLAERDHWVQRSLLSGNLVYYYLRRERNRY